MIKRDILSIFFSLFILFGSATALAQSDGSSSVAVNVNTASVEMLTTLNGVGEARAKAIIEHRDKYGRSSNLEDLLEVNGIGEATIQQNQSRILFE